MSTRRDWLKRSLAVAATLPATTLLGERLLNAPASEAERMFGMINRQQPTKIRLNSNENPYGPPDRVKKVFMEILSEANRYTFDVVKEMKVVLAEKEGVTPDHIAIGAGSADTLAATGAAFSMEGGKILSAFPTYPTLMAYAEVFKAPWDKVNVNEELVCDYDEMASRVNSDTKLVFVCNPNNPTGTLVDPKKVYAFCEDISKRVPVFADEAYMEFLDPSQQVSAIELVKKDANVFVSRTFSKVYGLAGLRIGYLISKPDNIRKVAKTHPGIPMNQVAIAAAKACLGDTAFIEMTRKKNAEARKVLTDYLDKKKYFYGKSYTNFVMFDAKTDALGTLNKLAEKGIAIRTWDFNNRQWLRVSIGTVDEMKTFTKVFDEVIA
jgi:histidinol-phosphate aminotransferase